jgi:hypothetical protein
LICPTPKPQNLFALFPFVYLSLFYARKHACI